MDTFSSLWQNMCFPWLVGMLPAQDSFLSQKGMDSMITLRSEDLNIILCLVVLQIPSLTEETLDEIPTNTLVRFTGMVQDMMNPEFYIGEYKEKDGTWHTTKYSDTIDVSESPEPKFAERQPILVVPVPGMSAWMADLKRKEAKGSMHYCAEWQEDGAGKKRVREDLRKNASSMDVDFESLETKKKVDCEEDKNTKMVEGQGVDLQTKSVAREGKENYFDCIPQGSCVVQLYDGGDEIKLNDIIEVVGVLSRVPEIASLSMGELMEEDRDMLASKIPTSIAPRLHAIVVRKTTIFGCPKAIDKTDLAQARWRARGFLSMILGGDDLAAEYLLLQLISRVHTRNSDSSRGALGTMALNITGAPGSSDAGGSTSSSPFVEAISTGIAGLMPATRSLPLRIELLNKQPWYPGRFQDRSLLSNSPLQLSPGSILVLDETVMSTGQLNETGLKNLGVVQKVMQSQKLPYDFQFYQLDQPTDIPVVIVSVGKTMLKGVGEIHVPLKPLTSPILGRSGVEEALMQGDANPAREYISTVREMSFSIPESVEKVLEQEMTTARQKDASSITADTFHTWLNVRALYTHLHILCLRLLIFYS